MLFRVIISIVFLLFSIVQVFANKPENLNVVKEIPGSTVYFRMTGGKIPIQYKKDGKMHGKVVGLVSLIPSGQPAKDTGRWWLKQDSLCQRWDKWLDNKVFCYIFKKKGNTVYWTRNDGQKGTALLAD